MLVIEVLPTGYHAGENGFAVTTIEKRANNGSILFHFGTDALFAYRVLLRNTLPLFLDFVNRFLKKHYKFYEIF